ncbi:hypothetical protein HOLleu_03081 [Holothuria leucospilota]|uniref:Uncharacterized protein n=1 Tax=Holothuria leucospilota TaxID=206669 RepID=A0A9Q1CS43_HOLLE|nr:hypothetical protein HOLleu_03081 [Holothuria leucospilota]
MEINNKEVIFQVDTCATVNTLPEKYVHDSVTAPATKTLKMWNGTRVETRGKSRLIFKNPANRKKYPVEFVVTDNSFNSLLSLRAAQQMNFIKVNADNMERVMGVNEAEQFPEVFDKKACVI